MGSWGYGGYGAFPMVLWFLILIALIFGIILRVGCKTWRRVRAPFRRPRRNRKAQQWHVISGAMSALPSSGTFFAVLGMSALCQ